MIAGAALLGLIAASATGGDDFPVFVWCQDHAGSELPRPLLDAFGGVNIEGADSARWALEEGVEFYVGHAPGRNALHLQRDAKWYDEMWNEFYETRDTSRLVRTPCLNDPATWQHCAARLDKTLAARDGRHGRALSLGDEVGLTPWGDPLDLCASEHCAQRWTEWLTERGYAAEGEEYAATPSTDAVRLAYLEGETAPVHDWLDRRRFNQDLVLEFLSRLAARARSGNTPLALFGLTGQTAFGGVSIPRILPELDVVEAYSEGCARELLFTLRAEQEAWCTLFPAKGDADRGAHRLWEHWLRGGDGAIVWSDRELKRDSNYLARLSSAVSSVRAVHERFPGWRPGPSGIALVHDEDALAVAWLRDALSDGPTWPRRFAGYQAEHGTRERAVNSSLRLFEDCGVLPGALPLDEVSASTVQRFPVLACVHQVVVTRTDEAKLAAYLDAGGRLLLRGPFGLLGDRDQKDSKGAEARLAERFPGRVVRFKADLSEELDYNALRIPGRDARVAVMRIELAELMKLKHDWTIESEPAVPMLTAQQRLADGSLLCAAIPNLPTGKIPSLMLKLTTEERFEAVVPESAEVSGVQLAAGDAFVFLLRAN